jgi:hypothetical protein
VDEEENGFAGSFAGDGDPLLRSAEDDASHGSDGIRASCVPEI